MIVDVSHGKKRKPLPLPLKNKLENERNKNMNINYSDYEGFEFMFTNWQHDFGVVDLDGNNKGGYLITAVKNVFQRNDAKEESRLRDIVTHIRYEALRIAKYEGLKSQICKTHYNQKEHLCQQCTEHINTIWNDVYFEKRK